MFPIRHDLIHWTRQGFNRRRFLRAASATGVAGAYSLRDLVSLKAAELKRQQRSVIVLWMAGGPSQLETFDPKPQHANGGETETISTAIPGVSVAAAWEQTARILDRCALIRSLTNKEGNHRRATYQVHTGYLPSGGVKHPSLGANIAQQIGDPDLDLPNLVSIGKVDGTGAGFLGVQYEPLYLRDASRPPENTRPNVPEERQDRRLYLLDKLQNEYANRGAEQLVREQSAIYAQATNLVRSPDLEAFDISREPAEMAQAYGNTPFGRGCLLARRLVERGVSYVEVVSNGWDTHADNFESVRNLAGGVDPAMATLITDLEARGMLENTLVLWMGEFGRTPRINGRAGRDHFPQVFNALLAGAGVRGGQVVGASTRDGMSIKDRPVTIPDLFHSICQTLQVDPHHENIGPLGRPLKVVEGGEPVQELFS